MSGQATNLTPRDNRTDLSCIATGPNAQYIFPQNQGLDKCAVLISGDEDSYTGRDKILFATRLASGPASHTDGRLSSVPSGERSVRTSQSSGSTFELMDAPPSWHRSSSVLEYHVKYGQGFVFVFNMSSPKTLDLVREMLEAVIRTRTALGLVCDGGRPGSLPVVLVGNVDGNLRRREDGPRSQNQATTASVRAEAAILAERWGHEFFEVDTGSAAALSEGANEVVLAILQRIEEAKRTRRSGVGYGFSEVKAPQRLLVRRTVGRMLPGVLLKLFAK